MTLKCQKQGHEIYIEKHEKNGKESLLLGKKMGGIFEDSYKFVRIVNRIKEMIWV